MTRPSRTATDQRCARGRQLFIAWKPNSHGSLKAAPEQASAFPGLIEQPGHLGRDGHGLTLCRCGEFTYRHECCQREGEEHQIVES